MCPQTGVSPSICKEVELIRIAPNSLVRSQCIKGYSITDRQRHYELGRGGARSIGNPCRRIGRE